MTRLSQKNVDAIRKRVTSVLNHTIQDKKAIVSTYSRIDPSKDARITAFSKLIDVFRSMELSLIFVSKHLMDKHWWENSCENPICDNGLQSYLNGFNRFMKFGLVHGIFSCVESSLRVFLRALDPTACSAGVANFESIYICLLQSKLSKPQPDGVDLLHLFRLVRNTIHNNGVHFSFSKSRKDERIPWNGTTYEFKQGLPVHGITLDFILTISDDVRLLLRSVVEDSYLKTITHEITDPAGPYGS